MTDINIVCAYFGVPGDCAECGGHDDTGTRFCSTGCADAFRERAAEHRDQETARRAAEDAYGREVDRLLGEGHSYEQIDQLLRGMP